MAERDVGRQALSPLEGSSGVGIQTRRREMLAANPTTPKKTLAGEKARKEMQAPMAARTMQPVIQNVWAQLSYGSLQARDFHMQI